jgi:hypothetical protein
MNYRIIFSNVSDRFSCVYTAGEKICEGFLFGKPASFALMLNSEISIGLPEIK